MLDTRTGRVHDCRGTGVAFVRRIRTHPGSAAEAELMKVVHKLAMAVASCCLALVASAQAGTIDYTFTYTDIYGVTAHGTLQSSSTPADIPGNPGGAGYLVTAGSITVTTANPLYSVADGTYPLASRAPRRRSSSATRSTTWFTRATTPAQGRTAEFPARRISTPTASNSATRRATRRIRTPKSSSASSRWVAAITRWAGRPTAPIRISTARASTATATTDRRFFPAAGASCS